MADYIEREKLLEKLHEVGGCGAAPDTWADGYDKAIDVAYGIVQMTPAADVAEIVRCKDCKYFTDEGDGLSYCKYHTDNAGYCDDACWVAENDFCSYGARMDGEGE